MSMSIEDLKAIKPADLLAMIQQAQKLVAEEAAQLKAAEEAAFQAAISAINVALIEHTAALTTEAPSIALQLVPAVETAETSTPAFFRLVTLPSKAARRLAVRTESVNQGQRPLVTVDGAEYRSYNEAYDSLGYRVKNSAFNARAELHRLGHIVGPPMR